MDYSTLRDSHDELKQLYSDAKDAKEIISEVKQNINLAKDDGLTITDSLRVLNLAEAALERGDFETAYTRSMDAKTVYSLEIAGQFNLLRFISKNVVLVISLSLLVLICVILVLWSMKFFKLSLKLKLLNREKVVISGLIQEIQREAFEQNKLSMDEYSTALKQYEGKMSLVLSGIVFYETKKVKLLNPLLSEKDRIISEKIKIEVLLKETQDGYINKGKLETMVYKNQMKSYVDRLSEIEEQLAYFEAMEAIKHAKN